MSPVILASCAAPPVKPEDDPLLADALKKAGCTVCIRPWTGMEPLALPPGSIVVLRSTWDYHRHAERFLGWLADLEAAQIPVLNSPALVRLTIDKSWLTAERPFGCAAPVTLRVPADTAVISKEVRLRNWDRFILKPPVSASAEGTFLLDTDDPASLQAALIPQPGHVLLQEFLPEIRDGELSLVFLADRFSHAVRKTPAPGDFRVQEEFGSRTHPADPPPSAASAARRVLKTLPETPCYARIDGIMRGNEFLLMEVELIEPDLFLRLQPGAAEDLAEAVIRHIRTIRA